MAYQDGIGRIVRENFMNGRNGPKPSLLRQSAPCGGRIEHRRDLCARRLIDPPRVLGADPAKPDDSHANFAHEDSTTLSSSSSRDYIMS
jgi:hypothetical protein